jgi:lysozyme
VIHKATQGLKFVDPLYAARTASARAEGLLWGAYHFGTGVDGTSQAKHFLDTVQPDPRTLLALDLEADPQGPDMTLDQARAFVMQVYADTGRLPGLYGGYYVKQLLGGNADPVLGRCWLWWSQYGSTPVVPPNWPRWTLWQYTDGAAGPEPHAVAGIGRCDRDTFVGDVDALRQLWNA